MDRWGYQPLEGRGGSFCRRIWSTRPRPRSAYLHYLAEVREFDRQVGDTVRGVEKRPSSSITPCMIVLDENGAGMPGGKWTVFDWGVRSACVIKCPDSWEANFETDAIAQYCDIVPTLVDAVRWDALGGSRW